MRRPTEAPPPGEPRELTDAEAADFLDAHRVALLAFVGADDDALRARLALLAARLGRPGFGVGILDVTRHRLVAEAMGVKAAPTLVVFAEGEAVDRLMGSPPEAVLEETVRMRLGPP